MTHLDQARERAQRRKARHENARLAHHVVKTTSSADLGTRQFNALRWIIYVAAGLLVIVAAAVVW